MFDSKEKDSPPKVETPSRTPKNESQTSVDQSPSQGHSQTSTLSSSCSTPATQTPSSSPLAKGKLYIGWLTDWLAGWLAGWLLGWLVGKTIFNVVPKWYSPKVKCSLVRITFKQWNIRGLCEKKGKYFPLQTEKTRLKKHYMAFGSFLLCL